MVDAAVYCRWEHCHSQCYLVKRGFSCARVMQAQMMRKEMTARPETKMIKMAEGDGKPGESEVGSADGNERRSIVNNYWIFRSRLES
jgi:hypothetical protein